MLLIRKIRFIKNRTISLSYSLSKIDDKKVVNAYLNKDVEQTQNVIQKMVYIIY